MGDVEVCADGGGVGEFAAVPLAVIDGKGVQHMAGFVQMVEQDSGIEPSGIDDDGFHEFSGLPEMAAPWEFSEQGGGDMRQNGCSAGRAQVQSQQCGITGMPSKCAWYWL